MTQDHHRRTRWVRRIGYAIVGSALLLATILLYASLPDTPAPAPAQMDPVEDSRSIRVLTYNVHLLPFVADVFAAKRFAPRERAQEIAIRLNVYDIVGLCEVFDARRRRELLQTLRTQTDGEFIPIWTSKPAGYQANSGLMLLSRFPVVAHHSITFDQASSVLHHGLAADGFAAKGALHARLQIGPAPGSWIDCFLTHLESRSDSIRDQQLATLSEFVGRYSQPDVPFLVMGDMNVTADDIVVLNRRVNSRSIQPDESGRGAHVVSQENSTSKERSQYREMLQMLRVDDRRIVDVWPHLENTRGGTSDPNETSGGRRIDYVFCCSRRGESTIHLEPTKVRIHAMMHQGLGQTLSDHAALDCSFRVETR